MASFYSLVFTKAEFRINNFDCSRRSMCKVVSSSLFKHQSKGETISLPAKGWSFTQTFHAMPASLLRLNFQYSNACIFWLFRCSYLAKFLYWPDFLLGPWLTVLVSHIFATALWLWRMTLIVLERKEPLTSQFGVLNLFIPNVYVNMLDYQSRGSGLKTFIFSRSIRWVPEFPWN